MDATVWCIYEANDGVLILNHQPPVARLRVCGLMVLAFSQCGAKQNC